VFPFIQKSFHDACYGIVQDKAGIIPALQKFSYAGKNLEDSQRTLEQYGIAYWNAKFPGWPLKIRKH
jgi:hypothetical protein